MAKRKQQPTPVSDEDPSVRSRIIKLRLTESENRVLRVAAALENLRPAEFARNAVLERSRGIAKEFLSDDLE